MVMVIYNNIVKSIHKKKMYLKIESNDKLFYIDHQIMLILNLFYEHNNVQISNFYILSDLMSINHTVVRIYVTAVPS